MALHHFKCHREIKRCISQFGCKFYTVLFVYFYFCCVELGFLLWNLSDSKGIFSLDAFIMNNSSFVCFCLSCQNSFREFALLVKFNPLILS